MDRWTIKVVGRYTVDVPNIVTKTEDVVVRFYTPGPQKGLRARNDVTDFTIRKVADKTEIPIDMKAPHSLVKELEDQVTVELEVMYRQK